MYGSAVPSGENMVVRGEIKLLTEADVEVSTLLEHSDSLVNADRRRMANAALGTLYSPTGVRRFESAIARNRPDVVHLHNPFPLISPAVIRVAKAKGIPVVQTIHNYRHACVNSLFFKKGA